jgi:hypothetical protein
LDTPFKVADKRSIEACSFLKFSLRYLEFLLTDHPNYLSKRSLHPKARLNLFSVFGHFAAYRAYLSVIGQGSVTDNSTDPQADAVHGRGARE